MDIDIRLKIWKKVWVIKEFFRWKCLREISIFSKNLFCDISLPCRYDKAGKIFVVIITKLNDYFYGDEYSDDYAD